jgi:thiamine biosynthesis lipoprotein
MTRFSLSVSILFAWTAIACKGPDVAAGRTEAIETPRPPALPAPPPAVVPLQTFTPERIRVFDKAMGTHLEFVAYTTESVGPQQLRETFEAAVSEIRRIEALMTTWRPDSEVSRINAAAGKSAVVVGDETLSVIQNAIRTSEQSEGTFDITFETLHGLWKFDEDLDPHPPSEVDVKARLPFVGFKNIVVNAETKSIKLLQNRTRIGLGGIAKGYAVDRAVALLDAAKVPAFFVQAGGDLFARGKKPDGTEWQAGIRDPRGTPAQYFATLALRDHAFSTAGDYERSYIKDGRRYHHIIDPRTGFPATASRSVTIWAPSALAADAIDDAVFILGPEKGLRLVESMDGVGAVIVDPTNRVWVSNRLRGKVAVVAVPGDGI